MLQQNLEFFKLYSANSSKNLQVTSNKLQNPALEGILDKYVVSTINYRACNKSL